MSNKLPLLLFDAVGAELKPFGFKAMKSKKRFVRRVENRIEVFGLPVVHYTPTYYARPWAGVRFDEVEEIFHQTSGFERAFQSDTHTVGIDFWRIWGTEGYDIPLQEDADVTAVVSRLLTIFQEKALPYYEQFHDLPSVDAALNDQPNEPSVHCGMPSNRCSKGIIVAKLTGRANYDELVSIYRSTLKLDNNGYYLPAIELLLGKIKAAMWVC